MENKEIIFAPIEIESEEQLRDLGISRKDCSTMKIGFMKIPVYLVPADQDSRDFLVHELRVKYAHKDRQSRCQVPGKIKDWIRCPETNCCVFCPYGKENRQNASRDCSLDELMEEGFDHSDGKCLEDQVEMSVLLENLFTILRSENPLFPKVISLVADGHTLSEVAEILGISRGTVVNYLRRIRTIAADYMLDN